MESKEGKQTYIIKPTHTIKHNGAEYKEGDSIELTEDEAKKLHVESADKHQARLVMEGKATFQDSPTPNTKLLIKKIEAANSEETVEALKSLTTVKAVYTAGAKRIKELKAQADTPEKVSETSVTVGSLLQRIEFAQKDALDAIGKESSDLPEADAKTVSDAIKKRKEDLKG